MRKFLLLTVPLFVLSSCASQYNVRGTSNVTDFDGRMLYLKVLQDNNFENIDSCDVVHGQFHFSGTLDSAQMANLFMDEQNILTFVLEEGDIDIKINTTQQTVSGTPLNDKLYNFFEKYNQLKNREAELVHLHDQAIMNGEDMNAVVSRLNNEASNLSSEEDKLVTGFVKDNYDNVLGPGVFFMVTIGYQYPQLTPWIEDVLSRATPYFKNNSYVKDYYQKAQENEQIMNGMKDIPVTDANTGGNTNATPPPTPNEMAQPKR